MQLTVTRPREVTVYGCDGPECPNICERENNSGYTRGYDCKWIWITDHNARIAAERLKGQAYLDDFQKFFCSWRCLANWGESHDDGTVIPGFAPDNTVAF